MRMGGLESIPKIVSLTTFNDKNTVHDVKHKSCGMNSNEFQVQLPRRGSGRKKKRRGILMQAAAVALTAGVASVVQERHEKCIACLSQYVEET